MIDTWSDDRLAEVLASVGEHLHTGGGTAFAEHGDERRAGRGSTPWQWPRFAAAAAAVAAAVAGTVLAIAPVREAVADWLGIGSTEVDIVPAPAADPTGLPTLDAGLTPISEATASARIGAPLPDMDSTSLGHPAQILSVPEGGALLSWPDGATTLWIHGAAIQTDEYLSKLVDVEDDVRSIDDVGDAALMIIGGHVLETPHRTLAARTVLLWSDAGIEYRLESDLDPDTMIDIARALD